MNEFEKKLLEEIQDVHYISLKAYLIGAIMFMVFTFLVIGVLLAVANQRLAQIQDTLTTISP